MSKENLTPYNSETGRAAAKKQKRGRSLKTVLRELLEKEIDLSKINTKSTKELADFAEKMGFRKKLYGADIIALRDYMDAINGKDKATERMWGYSEGKPSQPIQQENTIEIKIVDD